MLKLVQKSSPPAKRSFRTASGPDDQRPLNERIKRFVLAKIDSGAWPEGYRVPSETELANAFGTARMTVHGALHDLAAAGILTRRPGAEPGSHTAGRNRRCSRSATFTTKSSSAATGIQPRCTASQAETCDLETATEPELPPGSAVFHSVIVHFEDNRPIQIENRFVRPAFAPRRSRPGFLRWATPYEFLMKQVTSR